MKKQKKIYLYLSIFSVLLVFVFFTLFFLRKISFNLTLGVILGTIFGWTYALISVCSTNSLFKNENPYLQLGLSVFKVGMLFFLLVIVFCSISGKDIVYGSLIGLINITVYHLTSAIIFIK